MVLENNIFAPLRRTNRRKDGLGYRAFRATHRWESRGSEQVQLLRHARTACQAEIYEKQSSRSGFAAPISTKTPNRSCAWWICGPWKSLVGVQLKGISPHFPQSIFEKA